MTTAPSALLLLPLAASLLALAPRRGVAQRAVVPPAGAVVRVRTGEPLGWHEGVLVGVDSASVRFVRRGTADTLRVAVRDVAGVELFAGRRSRAGRGALIGLAAGSVAGAGVMVAMLQQDTGCRGMNALKDLCGFVTMMGAAGGAFLGTVVGALVGASNPEERWTPVVLSGAQVGSGVGAPTRRSAARIGVARTFGGP